MKTKSRPSILPWVLLVIFLLAGGLFTFWLSFQPYAQWKALGDAISKDHNFQSITPTLVTRLSHPLSLTGLLLLGLGICGLIFRKFARTFASDLLNFPGWFIRTFCQHLPGLLRSARTLALQTSEAWTLAAITLVGLLVRIPFLSRMMMHDEAYTIMTFGAGSMRSAIEEYPLPNNHVLHSILVNLSYHLLGNQPWMVRLPALIAGVLLIPAAYTVARKLYNRPTALFSAGLVAASPYLVDYSTNARGYTLFALITLLELLAAVYLLKHKNLGGWVLFILLAALGFYTLPMMIYPFGLICVWLGLSALLGQAGPEYSSRWTLIKYLILAGVFTGLVSFLLYTPIFLHEGLNAVFHNTFVRSLTWSEFWPTAASRMNDLRAEWTAGIPGVGVVLLCVGFLAGLVLHRRISSQKLSFQLAALLWIVPVVLYQRPNPWVRIWTFLLPLCLIWAAAGVIGLLDLIHLAEPARKRLRLIMPAILVMLALGISGARTLQANPGLKAPLGEEEQTVLFIQQHLKDTDLIVVNSPNDTPIWYYARVHGIPQDRFQRNLPFFHIYVPVNAFLGQNFNRVMAERGPEMAFINLSTLHPAAQFGNTVVYEADAYPDMIREAYHLQP